MFIMAITASPPFYFDRIITPKKPIVKANILKIKHSKNRIYLNCQIFGMPETLLRAKIKK